MEKYVDMHCHCHEFNNSELAEYTEKNFLITCVSDDPISSNKTIELSKKISGITPCTGIHPWVAEKYSEKDALRIVELAIKNNVLCLGEVGLDKIFVPQTYNHQLKIFEVFVDAAKEYDLVLNLHTAGTWREVFEILLKKDIKKAYFHWYTGSLTLAEEIGSSGYYVGANPAWKIQKKHRKILEYLPMEYIITESDSPYKYKSLKLSPSMIIDTINFLSQIKKISPKTVASIIHQNYTTLFMR